MKSVDTVSGNIVTRAFERMTEDEELRGLLTDREREILSGEADVGDSYYYRVVSKVRKKISRLAEDRDILDEYHETLSEELDDAVCGEEDGVSK